MKARAMRPWMPHCSGPLTDAICTDVARPLSLSPASSGDRLLRLRCTLTQKGDSIMLHMQPWWSGVSELYYLPISGPGPHSAHYEWKWWFVSVQKEDQRMANVRGLHSANNASDRTRKSQALNLDLNSIDRLKESFKVQDDWISTRQMQAMD